MTIKEYVSQALNDLSDAQLEEVAEFVSFLKFRARRSLMPAFDTDEVAALYAEFAEEDRQLAEEGIEDYSKGLLAEDAARL